MTAACLMPVYQPLPLSFHHGKGTRLWDHDGREYLDAVAGVGVTNVGHSHPTLVAALREQAGLLLHTSNLYGIDWQQRLAERLCALSGMERAFFNNSGAEANETALKLARMHGWRKGIERPLVIVMDDAFHGRTLGTLAASDGPAVRLGFGSLPGDFLRVPFGDLHALDEACDTHGARIAAVLIEPVQGEGGVHPAPAGYLTALSKRCTRRNWLLMVDEIQSGMGRTGQWFAYQHEKVLPDIITLAKGLGNGVPIGACLAKGKAAELLTYGSHGSTFGGNPFACRAGCTVIDIIEQEGLLANARDQGRQLLACLTDLLDGHSKVKAIRGLGLMIGVELHEPVANLALRAALDHRLLINVTRARTVRLLPPLTLTAAEAEMIAHGVRNALDGVAAEPDLARTSDQTGTPVGQCA